MGTTLLLPFGLPAWAGEWSPTEQDFFMDMPVALTATRLEQPLLEAPASITVVDREWLEASQARDLTDLLRLVPGMIVGQHNGNHPMVAYQGLGQRFTRQMQVLIDGRSIYSPTTGGAQWADLDLHPDDIERIEIIRGPNAAAYGSNAFSAIINVLTRHASDTQGQQIHTRLGSRGIRDIRYRLGGSDEEAALAYRVSLSQKHDDGLTSAHDEPTLNTLRFRADWLLSHGWMLTTHAGLFQAERRPGSTHDVHPPFRNDTLDSGHLQLRLEEHSDMGTSHVIQYFFQQNDGRAFFANTPDDPAVTVSRRHDIELERHRVVGQDSRWVVGAGVRRDQSRSEFYYDHGNWVNNELYRLFGHLEWSPNAHWMVHLGGMYEHNDLVGDEFLPRAGITFMPTDTHSIRAVVSRATRTPSLVEAYARGRIPGTDIFLLTTEDDLHAEVIRSYELGYHGQFDQGRVTVDLKGFHNIIEHIIQMPYEAIINAQPPGVIRNEGNLRISGVEGELGYRPHRRLRLTGGLSLMQARSDGHGQTQADSVPSHVVNLGMILRPSDDWRIMTSYYHYGDIRWIDDPGSRPVDAGDGFLDLHLTHQLSPRLEASLSITDLLAGGYDTRSPDSNWRANPRKTGAWFTLSAEF
ncbi:TonB-dependent receptor plug domain-containing protein [Ectothiorhodospira variabilis]|uniref:TonB-dependent receptor plug domain-containing protein n=1 Tax=Ectothiorhodospira variabilis TaxID=505694 RepID=UPI001EFBA1AC|nr:TonB-dependent receptor [Ectothiorhodospira variabilis]MCG5493919.1 TonB-dependent receptor [Ectothiorhodospira variabilis]MCG5498133.1 TonB-dependent receptor [Ectothiorhodospira variabilis]MCG5503722.1 TonB-dependent receptor [Ectothiorhodospira variabilis]MCG5506878.1 TonB-dependent receptor [Ectothiorhodospira variabilis]